MEFLYPSFLWALLALAVPIIIHLFSFRRFKKVLFTNIRFLKEIKEETSSKNKLKNLLILLMRCLALMFLVFAFAQPFIAQKENVNLGAKNVSVFVDNSFSMNALQDDIPLLDKAKEKARQIIEAYSNEDKFQILTHDFEGRHQRLVAKEDAMSLLEEIRSTPRVESVSKIINRQKQVLTTDENIPLSYIISDFQESISDFPAELDTTLEVNLVPIQSVVEKNISIDSVWFDAPVAMLNQTNKLLVKINNHSNEDVENIRLSYKSAGEEKPVGNISIDAGSSVIDSVNISILNPGWHDAELKITDYPIQFDDSYKIAFNVSETVKVLAINDGGADKYLDAVFRGLNYYSLTNRDIRQLQYGTFPDYQLIILNDLNTISSGLSSELDQFIANGGNVMAFPGSAVDIANYNTFLNTIAANNLVNYDQNQREVSGINTDEFVFKDVFESIKSNLKLPVTQSNYILTQYQNRGQETLLNYRDGSPYLAKYNKGDGHFYICVSPLDTEINDLVLNAEIFVPLLYKIALSSSKSEKIAYTIGQDEVIEADNRIKTGELVYRISGPDEFIPGQTNLGSKVLLDINNQISEAGFYDLMLEENKVLNLAFNYDRQESDPAILSVNDLEERLKDDNYNIFDNTLSADFTRIIGEKDKGIILWKWCLILALIFLALEMVILKLFKN